LARAAAEAGERRRASKMAAILRGMAMAAVAGHALEAAGPLRVNIGKRGAPFTISDALMAELAVARDTRHMSYLEPGGYTAGPGRRPEPGAAIDATFLSTGNRSAGRLEKWGPGAGRRDNHKPAATVGTRTRRILVAVLTNDRTGDSAAFGPAVGELKGTGALRRGDGTKPPVHGDGAHGSRKDLALAREAGCRLCAPIRTADSGRSNGTEGWHEEAVWQLAGARGAAARGVDVGRVKRKDRLASRECWKADVGQSIRSMVEYVFSTFKRTLGGHVAARKWENAVKEVARKVAIHSALQAAAGGA